MELFSFVLIYLLEHWILTLLLLGMYSYYYYATFTFDFFKKKGISYIEPRFIVGSVGKRVKKQVSFHDFQLYVYDYFKGKPYGGIFEGRRPTLYIFDTDLIKAVAVRDSEHFIDRYSTHSKQPSFFKRSLLNLKGSEWKTVRSTITPSFSSARLKNMVPLLQQCSSQMVKFLEQYDSCDVEMKDLTGHLTLEVIGACAFGIKTDALTDENAHFVELARQYGYVSTQRRVLILAVIMLLPNLMKYIDLSMVNPEAASELMKILKVTKAERRRADSKKSDFLQLLIEAAEKEKQMAAKTNEIIHLDDNTIDAQLLLFLTAGYETSSTLLSFAAHTLAVYPHLQEKLRQHIQEITNGRELTYELISELNYLEGFLLETLRMHPALARLERTCTKKYILPGTNININVGDIIAIPVYGIHMNPEIYPDPHEFKPERFIGDEKKNRPFHLYMGFGIGPRNCIGMRFAMLSAKIAMVTLLRSFKFSVCAKTENPVPIDKATLLLKPANGLWVKIEKL